MHCAPELYPGRYSRYVSEVTFSIRGITHCYADPSLISASKDLVESGGIPISRKRIIIKFTVIP